MACAFSFDGIDGSTYAWSGMEVPIEALPEAEHHCSVCYMDFEDHCADVHAHGCLANICSVKLCHDCIGTLIKTQPRCPGCRRAAVVSSIRDDVDVRLSGSDDAEFEFYEMNCENGTEGGEDEEGYFSDEEAPIGWADAEDLEHEPDLVEDDGYFLSDEEAGGEWADAEDECEPDFDEDAAVEATIEYLDCDFERVASIPSERKAMYAHGSALLERLSSRAQGAEEDADNGRDGEGDGNEYSVEDRDACLFVNWLLERDSMEIDSVME